MTGRVARGGFVFSDYILVRRALAHLVAKRAALILNETAPAPIEFIVEARANRSTDEEWDIVEILTQKNAGVVLEEVKSGAMDADERRVLWTRIRRTVGTLSGNPSIKVRLTTSAENPPTAIAHWRDLASHAHHAKFGEPPDRITSADKLACEAMYYLTHPGPFADKMDRGAPLAAAVARSLLVGFELVESASQPAMEKEIEVFVASLTHDVAVPALKKALLGALSHRAGSPDESIHRFTSDELYAEVAELQALFRLDPSAAKLWRELKLRSSAFAANPDPHGALPYRNWFEVQPDAHAKLATDPACAAIVGRGGLGKSVVLRALFDDRMKRNDSFALWINGADLAGVSAATFAESISLGRFVAACQNRSLSLFVDGIDDTGSPAQLSEHLALLSRAGNSGCRIYVTGRLSAWRSLSANAVIGWTEAVLQDWPEDIVTKYVTSSARPSVDAQTIALLRTPLLLDLFLRTFGQSDAIPASVQTRHALLREYWSRRVLIPDAPQSGVRRAALDLAAHDELRGTTDHGEHAGSAQLASEGVFTLRQGLYRFRHAFLRDFAAGQWLLTAQSELPKRLESCTATIARSGAVRALVEAVSASDSSLGEVIVATSEIDEKIFLGFAEALGELEDVSTIDLPRLMQPLAQRSARFVEHLFHVADLSRNDSWLTALAKLPSDPAWVGVTDWLSTASIESVCRYVSTMANSHHDDQLLHIVRVLRAWSTAPKFDAANARHWGFVIDLTCAHDHSVEALNWLRQVNSKSWWTKTRTLDGLPRLVFAAKNTGVTLPTDLLREIYFGASGYAFAERAVREQGDGFSNDEHMRIDVALLREDGLLLTRPDVFLPIVFGIFVGDALDEEEKRNKRYAHLDDSITGAPRALSATEEQVEELRHPVTSESEAVGELVDDLEGGYFRTLGGNDKRRLINWIENRLRKSLEDNDDFVPSLYWPTAKASRSLLARTLLLDALVVSNGPQEVLAQAVSEPATFHFRDAARSLHGAISRLWPSADAETRASIVANIRRTIQSPLLTAYGVAPLLCAVPSVDQPADLQPFLELYRERGWDPTPESEARARPVFRSAQDPYSPMAFRQLGESGQTAWNDLCRARLDLIRGVTSAAEQIGQLLFKALRVGFPGLEDLENAADSLSALETAVETIHRRKESIDEQQLRAIAEWCFEITSTQDPVVVQRRHEESDSISESLWIRAISVLDEVLVDETLSADAGLTVRLFAEIERVATGGMSAGFLQALHFGLRSFHWFKKDSPGRTLLRTKLLPPLRDDESLSYAAYYVPYLGDDAAKDLCTEWLVKQPSGATMKSQPDLAKDLGHFCGSTAAYGVSGGWKAMTQSVHDWLDSPAPSGRLADPAFAVRWLLGIAFGAKEALLDVGDPPDSLSSFEVLILKAWRRLAVLQTTPGLKDSHGSFPLYVLHPLSEALKQGSKVRFTGEQLYAACERTLINVLREGSASQIGSIAHHFDDEHTVRQIGANKLIALVATLDERSKSIFASKEIEAQGAGYGFGVALADATKMLQCVGCDSDATPFTNEKVHEILERWIVGGVGGALPAARAVREASGSRS